MLRIRHLTGVLVLVALAACDVSLPTGPSVVEPSLAKAPAQPAASGPPRSWFIAPNGSDANPGTAALPFLTIQKGVNSAGSSDTVVVNAGTYSITSGVMISNKKGTLAAPFVLRGVGTPILRDPTGLSLYWKGLVNVSSSSHVRISGLSLRNSGFFGVMIDRSSRVLVQQVSTVTSAASALYAANSYAVTVGSNDFADFCKLGQNARGIPCQEGVSIVSVDTFDVTGNSVHDARQNGSLVQPGGGEGIDIKEASKRGKVRFNKVWNLVQLGIYIDAWDKTLEDVEVYGNKVWAVTTGIVVASEMGGIVRNVRVHDNLIYRNGDDGISVSNYGRNGLRENIAIYNNTLAYNGYSAAKPPYCYLWGCGDWGTGVRVQTTNIKSSRVHDNISYNNATTVMESSASATAAVIDNNILFPVGKNPWAAEKVGLRPIKADPKFVFPGSNDYHLTSVSPAIRKAIGGDPLNVDVDKYARTVLPTDLGAYLFR